MSRKKGEFFECLINIMELLTNLLSNWMTVRDGGGELSKSKAAPVKVDQLAKRCLER